MRIYKFVTPFFGTEENIQDTTSPSPELEDDLYSRYLDTPCLLLSDDDASSCTDPDDASEWPLSWNTPTPTSREDGIVEDRHVRFDNARVRVHGMTLGDHPMCCDPLPLTLDWCHSDEIVYDINDYEAMRKFKGRGERGNVPRLSYWKRRNRLQEAGLFSISNGSEEYQAEDSKYEISEDPMFFGEDEEPYGYEEVAVSYNFRFPGDMVKVEIIED
jgi:hypothetical protein